VVLAFVAFLHRGQPRARNPACSTLPAAVASRHHAAFGPVGLSGADGERHQALRVGALVVAADVGEGVLRGIDGLLAAVVDRIHDLMHGQEKVSKTEQKQKRRVPGMKACSSTQQQN
jgi:hypothetical protein